jgi:hypothetical protein
LADEYRVRVNMKAGPFSIEEDAESTIKKSALRAADPNEVE